MFILLIIIYLAFISMGLPDSLLGSAWPSMYDDFASMQIANAGILSFIIASGTIASSLLSDRLSKKFKTETITLASILLTAAALLGFGYSTSFWALCLWAVPLGLGAGSIDTVLNNFVAVHYKAKHMNWLHCFWGIGAAIGPVIMSGCLTHWNSWHIGYQIVGKLQFLLAGVFVISLPLWRKVRPPVPVDNLAIQSKSLRFSGLVRLPGVKPTLLAFFCYNALDSTIGLWGSSYLVTVRNASANDAALWISLYYLGITLGRIVSGFLTTKFTQKAIICYGQLVTGIGLVLLILPLFDASPMIGLLLAGLGCAPIYPGLLHETPANFGNEHSQALMGVQMASAYVGTALVPPLFGFINAHISYSVFPIFTVILLIVMILMVNLLYFKVNIHNS